MTTAFNAELHLRLAGEHAVLDMADQRQGPPWDSALIEVGAALAAIGALSVETAQAIVDDYQLARLMRGDQSARHLLHRPPPAAPSPQPITAPRVVACERTIDMPWGHLQVHYVALGAESTSLVITATEASPVAFRRRGPMGPGRFGHAGPPFSQLSLTDDQGTILAVHFSGGGGGGEWHGQLNTQAPLSPVTRWIEIASYRIDLDDDRPPPPVSVEPVSATDPAERYLRLRLATIGHGPMAMSGDGVEGGIQALIAAGAVHDSDPVLTETRAIAAAFGGQGNAGAALPRPWASLLARMGAGSGASGTIPIGVVTPPVDGVAISILGLRTTEQGFELLVATSPGIHVGHFRQVDSTRIAWWAEDNRGNSYLGASGSWGGGPDHSEGTIDYWPALDTRATELRLMPTGLTERAIVALTPLPWAKRR
jgi:hypothetical protein